jgi:hypothetical protein
MRVAGRFLFAVLCVVLICGAIGALSGGGAGFPRRGSAFHKPHHLPPAIETAPVSAATSSTDEWIVAPRTGVDLQLSFGTRVAARRSSRAIAPALEAALDQRPPPRTFLA